MRLAKYGHLKWTFKNIFNIDRGSEANADTIRNAMVYKIKQKLDLPQTATYYINRNTKPWIKYDFRDYYVIVTQELFHLVIRCRDAKICNYKHSDYFAVIRAFTVYSKNLQHKYDIKTTPACLSDTIFDPITAISKIPQLQNKTELKMIKHIILCFLRLEKTYDKILKFELLREIVITPLTMTSHPNWKPKQIVAYIISTLLDCVPISHFGQVESVLYLFYSFYFISFHFIYFIIYIYSFF